MQVASRLKSSNKYLNRFIVLQTTQQTVIPPVQKLRVPCRGEATNNPINGAVEATLAFERKNGTLVSPAQVTLTEGRTIIQVTNPHSHIYTLGSFLTVKNFRVMSPQPPANSKPLLQEQTLLMNNHPEECEHFRSLLFHEQTENNVKRLYPTP